MPRKVTRRQFYRGVGRLLLLPAACALAPARRAAGADAAVSKEYQLKATCLFNFTHFVDWPPAAFANADAPVTIGVLGDDPFGTLLDELVKGEMAHDRKLAVKRSNKVEDLKGCHVLFVSKSEKARAAQILAALGDAPVLTVGEVEGFAVRGGAINFFLDSNKVRFEINLAVAKRRGLKISPQLIKLGTPVGDAG